MLQNLVEASFDLFRYLLLGDQLTPWELCVKLCHNRTNGNTPIITRIRGVTALKLWRERTESPRSWERSDRGTLVELCRHHWRQLICRSTMSIRSQEAQLICQGQTVQNVLPTDLNDQGSLAELESTVATHDPLLQGRDGPKDSAEKRDFSLPWPGAPCRRFCN